ncbi:MAG TPA: VWA domain-containing protein [Dehalococcoidia bacterium]|nr:VWA domain-containing protein [Dehalococcoidia bacterium]
MLYLGFGAPQLLPLVLLGAAAAALYLWVARRQRRAEQQYRGSGPAVLRAASVSPRRRQLKAALLVAAVALLALALARPQVGTQRTLFERQGTDVLIALDVSLSMSATDVQPSRLDRAKGAISALIDHLQGDRVGVVTFAGDAALRSPLTQDTEAADAVVQSVTFKDGGLQAGTSIGAALRQASDGFTDDRTRSKSVVLVSDGEDLGDDAAQAAQFVQSEGIALDTIGVGLPQPAQVLAPNPRTGQLEPRKDPDTGGDLMTTADPEALRQLAAQNRGHFYNGNTDDFAVQIADEIGRLEKTKFASGEGDVPIERFQLVAALGLGLLLLELLIPAARGRRRALALPLPWPRRRAAPAPRAPLDGAVGGD